MKICVLTTDTPHHTYFVRRIANEFPKIFVFCEHQLLSQPAASPCEFEVQRDDWENNIWFEGQIVPMASLAPTQNVSSVNDPQAISQLRTIHPDVILVFGTGILRAEVLQVQPRNTLNLHGGDPEEYRGLDTHLWAIYEKNFVGLVSTLHRVDRGIDTGEIVERTRLSLKKNMELFQLRALNTEACVEMSLKALQKIHFSGDVESVAQRKKGRYFSAMQRNKKDKCPLIFREHTAGLRS